MYLVAHTGVQLDVFLRAHGIPNDSVRRVRTISDTRGLHDETLYLLPGWHNGTMEPGVVHEWSCRVGRVVNITEAVARGEESFSNE